MVDHLTLIDQRMNRTVKGHKIREAIFTVAECCLRDSWTRRRVGFLYDLDRLEARIRLDMRAYGLTEPDA